MIGSRPPRRRLGGAEGREPSRRGCILLAAALIAVLSGCGSKHSAVDVTAPGSAKDKLSTEWEYRVPSGSMEPTLGIGARVIVSPGAPRVGEIVVFHPPEAAEQQQYMLGDNRGESDDSRFYGAVPASWIVGTVTACAPLTAYRTTLDRQMGIRACKLPGKHG